MDSWPLVCSGGSALAQGGYGIKVFFLGCVVAAGLFGAMTSSRKILWVQALPGAVALTLVLLFPA